MKLVLKLLIVCLIFSLDLALFAQEVISSGGDHHEKTSGSISFTIGEVVIETFPKTSNILTQGFHQTNLIAVAVHELPGLDYEISAYPNPAKDYVILKLPAEKVIGMEYRLYDVNGKLIQNKMLEGTETEIPFNDLSLATYFIKVIQGNKEIKTFKIVKQ